MRLTYLGHSAVQLETSGGTVLIDPFLTGNPRAGASADAVAADLIVLTHAHGDHWGDTEAIARRTGATVVGSAELAGYASGLGLKAHGMNVGGTHRFPFGKVRLTPAWHSSSFPDGTYGGMPTGLVLDIGGFRIYHAGDTALFSDMRLVGDLGIDLALLPIGDNYTMGPTDALEAVKLIRPRYVMPVHFGTFPLLEQDPAAFKRRVEAETSAKGLVLEPGEDMQLESLFARAR